MDKLSEHAIRMLEIADANDIPAIGNKQFRDIARAVYDTILQVQMLKMEDRKVSEIPTDCDTCRYADECDWEPWQECPYEKCVNDYIRSISKPTGVNIFDFMDEPQTDLLVKTPRKSRDSHEKEPQTDCAWGKGE